MLLFLLLLCWDWNIGSHAGWAGALPLSATHSPLDALGTLDK